LSGIQVLGLSKSYKSIILKKEVNALQQVFFSVNKGELLGVMGHNGAGKSTLINLLCGAIGKDDGEVNFYGRNIDADLRQVRKRMGVVTQQDVLWDELTGIEHMQLYHVLKRADA
jgi:ABC-type multidrug transport system ATPase subunit